MPRNRIGMSFAGFEEMAAEFDALGGELREVITECLEKSHGLVTPKLHADMARHRRTGRTERSILDDVRVEWSGTKAFVDVGFDIQNGGLASIFLMYGTPRMKKDTKLYNDIYGKKTRDEIRALQEEIFRKKMDGIMGRG
ncbi:MAG: hypothetical protein HFE61_08495 [Anaerotignum sp.]|jgi:hypothetical protein|nr:hypothetical protein [Anaerotignum sp.]